MFTASTWETLDKRSYIPLSMFDQNNTLAVHYTPAMLGLYNVKFHSYASPNGGVAIPVSNGT